MGAFFVFFHCADREGCIEANCVVYIIELFNRKSLEIGGRQKHYVSGKREKRKENYQ